MWVAMSSGGVLTKREFVEELQTNRICPLLYYEKDGKKIVPWFKSPHLAKDFASRNTPSCDSIGVMELRDSDKQSLLNSGFEFEELEWPNKREVFVHVLFLECEVETIVDGYRKK